MAEIKGITIYGENEWSDINPLELDDKRLIGVDWDKYIKEIYPKNQIILHHTVSGPEIYGDLITWKRYKAEIATSIIIERDGTIKQLFSSRYFAWHLGCGRPNLDRHSIAIELDNWGPLRERQGKLFTIYGNIVDVETTFYPTGFRGKQLYEAYSIPQLKSLGALLLYWKERYKIPLTYHSDMWDVNEFALAGHTGLYTHVSYRPYPEKSDCHPDKNLIAMIKTIENK